MDKDLMWLIRPYNTSSELLGVRVMRVTCWYRCIRICVSMSSHVLCVTCMNLIRTYKDTSCINKTYGTYSKTDASTYQHLFFY